jgi:hypothetical protein
MLVLLWLALPVSQSAVAQSTNAITTEDLVRLSKEGLGDALIISMINAANRVPQLTPDDVLALKNAGVSTNVLTAVFQRYSYLASNPQQKPSADKRRRIRVTGSLVPQEKSWWRRGSNIERTVVSWSFRASAWRNQESLDLPPQPRCPKDPLCTKWGPDDKCLEAVAADSPAWKEQQACYLAGRVTELGEEFEVFDVELPEPASDAEIHIYYRSVDNERLSWYTRSADNKTGKRVPGFVKLRLSGSDDLDVKVSVQLFISRDGLVQDFRVTECEVANRDQASLERRLLSPNRLYCGIEEAPF